MNKVKLGEKPDLEHRRDAIHLPVVACRAGERLKCGDPVYVEYRDNVSRPIVYNNRGAGKVTIGVVDPFLPFEVDELELVWVVLEPGNATNLTHSWTHFIIDELTFKPTPPEMLEDIEQTDWCDTTCF